MKITNIKIKRIAPQKGHVGFVSFVVDNWLFLNNIAIFTRLEHPEMIRLVFPEKKVEDKKIGLFYPLTTDSYFELEKAILKVMKEI